MIKDEIAQDETGIKIRFNNLLRQFVKNKKYMPASLTNLALSDSEDISYEMQINKKRYEASFYQIPTKIDSLETQKAIRSKLLEKYTEEELENPTEEQLSDFKYESMMYLLDLYSKLSVWFMIEREYDEYYILMFYDNEYNQSDGEDL